MLDNGDQARMERAQPESFRGRALSASITVKDLPTSMKWYCDVVGFVEDGRYEIEGKLRSVMVKAGDVRILLNQDDGAKGWDRQKYAGVSLQITTAQNVDDVANRIRNAGGTLASEPADMPWGTRAFRVYDPDGFQYSISSPL